MRRVTQDSTPTAYMYTPSGSKDAQIARPAQGVPLPEPWPHIDRQTSMAEKQLRRLALGEAAFGKRGADEEEDKPGNEEDLVALAKPGLFLVLLHKRNLA